MYWMIIHKQSLEVLAFMYYDHVAYMEERDDIPEKQDRTRTYRSGEYFELPYRDRETEDRDPIGEVASFEVRLRFLRRFFEEPLKELIGP